MITQAANEAGVPPALVKAVAKAESGFDPQSTSGAGAQGLMQLMPGTARGLGVTDPYDPLQSLRGGAKYLRQMLDRFGGDYEKAIAAYNAGPGAVARYDGVPPYAETQAYVPRVMGYFQDFGGATGTTGARRHADRRRGRRPRPDGVARRRRLGRLGRRPQGPHVPRHALRLGRHHAEGLRLLRPLPVPVRAGGREDPARLAGPVPGRPLGSGRADAARRPRVLPEERRRPPRGHLPRRRQVPARRRTPATS